MVCIRNTFRSKQNCSVLLFRYGSGIPPPSSTKKNLTVNNNNNHWCGKLKSYQALFVVVVGLVCLCSVQGFILAHHYPKIIGMHQKAHRERTLHKLNITIFISIITFCHSDEENKKRKKQQQQQEIPSNNIQFWLYFDVYAWVSRCVCVCVRVWLKQTFRLVPFDTTRCSWASLALFLYILVPYSMALWCYCMCRECCKYMGMVRMFRVLHFFHTHFHLIA